MKRLSYSCMAIVVLVLFMSVSTMDYQAEIEENAHWCQMISDGVWYSSEDEFAARCE